MVRKERLELSQVAPLEPKSSASTNSATFANTTVRYGVNDGTRTHDNRDHNPGLYQLSYAHHTAGLTQKNEMDQRILPDLDILRKS